MTYGTYFSENLNRNLYIFIQENAFEYVLWKMAAILSWPQLVNTFRPEQNGCYFAGNILGGFSLLKIMIFRQILVSQSLFALIIYQARNKCTKSAVLIYLVIFKLPYWQCGTGNLVAPQQFLIAQGNQTHGGVKPCIWDWLLCLKGWWYWDIFFQTNIFQTVICLISAVLSRD